MSHLKQSNVALFYDLIYVREKIITEDKPQDPDKDLEILQRKQNDGDR
jgi:hypothetical protein